MTKYFKVYWGQIRAFYRGMNQHLFYRQRNLDGPLRDFVMKPGVFWELLRMHGWVVVAAWRTVLNIGNLLAAYVAFVLCLVIYLFAPVIIVVAAPFSFWNQSRRVRRRGAAL